MNPHLVCVGGEDHPLRIPFLLSLREQGFRLTAVSSDDGTAFSRHGIPHRHIRFDRFASSGAELSTLRSIRGLMSELRPDIVQSFDTKPNLLTPLAVRGQVPVVRTINGLGWTFSSLEPRALALRPVFCSLQWLASFWTAVTVFQNRDDQAFFERWQLIGKSAARLIAGSGIDVEAFATVRRCGPSAATMREQLGLHFAEVVMFVGRLTRQKGIPTLLEAVPRILKERPNARFILVGPRMSEGPFAVAKADIDRYAPHVLALGPRTDIPALLGMADLFAFPTQYREGIPRVLLEAGLAGLPIVASRMPGCNDVVEDGWNGYLVAPRDVNGFASRIIDLLSDRARAKTMGDRSVGFVRERFALSGVVDQYCDLYRRILSGAIQTGLPGQATARDPGNRQLSEAPQ
ncbi:glycosyltransferase family 4 protein [Mesorhizobium humile]|uniref:Glycosyltransferase family 4 protein n=1 Tax=Mesorhizobium humile TaxID=3072313 RepID=A0ABU4YCF7_9HYPH|nr:MULTISPECIES: glycosyltransferase family 4 protein [unclassified Mesorhizobium]MDX8458850.1 glycosyltransferase family 4 protein [Mesorhizobium sp. VK2D]MDX8484633.1 glycosyltransferase family 4 protein [Mesorhizobium sp. VK2B]